MYPLISSLKDMSKSMAATCVLLKKVRKLKINQLKAKINLLINK